ncbi:hypothetical protein DFH07DRAFT_582870 [Mycena maculata]|uniref:Uncharacterized protein n=1 Tax=Mycena maculata TaxID=230809 RepID=A0AAD7N5W2_9AGAR|nr:hypothetical protein DFH07DRAFT_582870 [Mycena maculata]
MNINEPPDFVPRGIHLSSPTDPSNPVDLPVPSFPFHLHVENPGIAIIDKSRYIPKLDDLLRRCTGCILTLPPGTGKTTVLAMLVAWYDCHPTSKSTFDKIFSNMDVGRQLRGAVSTLFGPPKIVFACSLILPKWHSAKTRDLRRRFSLIFASRWKNSLSSITTSLVWVRLIINPHLMS